MVMGDRVSYIRISCCSAIKWASERDKQKTDRRPHKRRYLYDSCSDSGSICVLQNELKRFNATIYYVFVCSDMNQIHKPILYIAIASHAFTYTSTHTHTHDVVACRTYGLFQWCSFDCEKGFLLRYIHSFGAVHKQPRRHRAKAALDSSASSVETKGTEFDKNFLLLLLRHQSGVKRIDGKSF